MGRWYVIMQNIMALQGINMFLVKIDRDIRWLVCTLYLSSYHILNKNLYNWGKPGIFRLTYVTDRESSIDKC